MGKKRGKNRDRNYSTIKDHKFEKGVLTPPFAQLPKEKMQLLSWVDDRLPELMWAALIITLLPRNDALNIFRNIAHVGFENKENPVRIDITLSGLARLDDDKFFEIVGKITTHTFGRHILKPLLLIESLPGKARWRHAIGKDASTEDWKLLEQAVICTLDHQSQEATDCRWLVVLFLLLDGGLQAPREIFLEIAQYPDVGDMRSVRPSIRSMEMATRMMPLPATAGAEGKSKEFCQRFWLECRAKTDCKLNEFDSREDFSGDLNSGATIVWKKLSKHFLATNVSTAVDAKHDSSFGFVFYALSLIIESGENQGSISSRLALRALTETYITFKYLSTQSKPELWQSYRVYGAGQAKLAFLKLMESTGDLPDFATQEELERICNEDVFQEYLEINTAHWDKTNLRSMAEKADCKDVYDNYYGWTSTYTHGHWGAMRDTVFATCFNPLHRLHRIPRSAPRHLTSALPSMIRLTNKMIEVLESEYPGLNCKLYEIPS